jgi:glucose-1-phosphate adenylyltransferase
MHSNIDVAGPATTFILAASRDKRLFPLTSGRAKSLVSFGGLFQIIDFTLSNCVNSGIERAYVLTDYKSATVCEYVASASWRTELTCLSPRAGSTYGYRGTADAIYQNLSLVCRDGGGYVLVLPAGHVYNMDYRKLLRFHADHGGDVTVATAQYPLRMAESGVVEIDSTGQVIGLQHKSENAPGGESGSRIMANMGVYVFTAVALRRALLRAAAGSGRHDLTHDVLPGLIRSAQVFAYDFTVDGAALGSYWRDLDSVDCYYLSQMELLTMDSPLDTYTHARWPAYSGGKPVSSFEGFIDPRWAADSIVAPGARVSQATVLQSVVGSNVEAGAGARIQRSVLMCGAVVGRGAKLRRVIVDEGVFIPDYEMIGFDADQDRRRFMVTENGVVVVHAGNRRPLETPSSRASGRLSPALAQVA